MFPTWEGVAAQLGAAVFVLGSYAGAEWLRARRRREKIGRLDARPQPRHELPAEPVAVARVAGRG